MSDLSSSDNEKRKLERLFEMEGGYVLDFSNASFRDFVQDNIGRDIDDPRYTRHGTGSKAWRLREFWKVEHNHVVGKLISALIDYRTEIAEQQALDNSSLQRVKRLPDEERLTEECRHIAARLTQGQVVNELDALKATADEPDFEIVASEVRAAIDRNQLAAGLDRLHTFAIKFGRSLCAARGIPVTRDTPLHSVFGAYVKVLREAGHIESQMTAHILKSSVKILESFNDVRNKQSLAHDNLILNHDESLLIFNYVASTIRFLRALEERLKNPAPASEPPPEDDFPF